MLDQTQTLRECLNFFRDGLFFKLSFGILRKPFSALLRLAHIHAPLSVAFSHNQRSDQPSKTNSTYISGS